MPRDIDLLRRTKERLTRFGAVNKIRDHEMRIRRTERADFSAGATTVLTNVITGDSTASSASGFVLRPETLAIASGAVTITGFAHWIDTEGAAASDDLDTINTPDTSNRLLYISAANDGRTVVVKHNTGNILCVGNADITLDDAHDFAVLWYDSVLTKWKALMGSAGGSGAPTSAQYVTMASDGTLSAERVLGDGVGTDVIDGTTTVKINLLLAPVWAIGGR